MILTQTWRSSEWNNLLSKVLNFLSQINIGMKKDQFSFTLAMKDQQLVFGKTQALFLK